MKKIDELSLDEKEINAVKHASKLLRERFPVEEVILYGSKARGDDDPESDIDLLLLTSRPIDWREREEIINALFDVEITYDVVISILDTTVRDWRHGIFTAFPIHEEVSRDGVLTT